LIAFLVVRYCTALAVMDDVVRREIDRRTEALARVRSLLIERLKVPFEPEEIDLDAPLFGTGLGLDSVDAVELIVGIELEFGLEIPEGSTGPWAFRTVQSLVEFVLDPPPLVIRRDREAVG
jgi:acyl carrier protein